MKTATKRSTIYFDPDLYKTLKVKAALSHRTISEIVNIILKRALAEDAEDSSAFEERASETNLDFEGVLRSLKNPEKM